MERDFMGLGVKVKQEISKEITEDSATGRSSTMMWSVSNKVKDSIPQSPLFTSPFQAKSNGNDVVDITKIRNTYVATEAPAQLTIFYAGSVCVFDDVSFEKAQAIMLLAGNGPPLSSPSSVPPSPLQTPAVQPSIADSSVANRSHNTKPPSFSSQISPALTSNLQFVGRSVYPDDPAATQNIGTLRPPPGSVGAFPANVFSTGSVPQFRKASLARFLEKRKERVMNASRYSSHDSAPLPATRTFGMVEQIGM